MKNWSGYLQWFPSEGCYPASVEAIQAIVQKARKAGRKIRVIGTGHSFSALCPTEEILISLDQYQGLVAVDAEQKQVTVKAGTKLHLLNELLHKEGLGLLNLGDINEQSIAGTIATGTHGTGTAFGNVSTQVVKLQWVNGLGEIVHCCAEENPELFKAAALSLGTLGIISQITLQCVAAYKLELMIDKSDLKSTLEKVSNINAVHRNFEFYWFPNTDTVMTKISNIIDAPPDRNGFGHYLQEMLLENYAFKMLCECGYYFPRQSTRLSRFSARTISAHRKVAFSHQVYVTPRLVRFNEMEYSVPIEAYAEVKKDLVRWINKHNRSVHFPIENRFVKGDDLYLSPAYQRDAAYIACHVYHKKDFKPFFGALEQIFARYGGRPHWGKIHTLEAAQIRELYPRFDNFLAERARQDPEQIFVSPYIQRLLGL